MTATTPSEVRGRIDECLVLIDYVIALCWIFGIPTTSVPVQVQSFETLTDWRRQVVEVENAPRQMRLANADAMLQGVHRIHEVAEATRRRWMSGPIKVRCSDEEVRRLSCLARDGSGARLSKAEFDERFDVSAIDPFWRWVPDYTFVVLGHGLMLSSPEWDMFYAMCHFHDRAVSSGQRIEAQPYLSDHSEDSAPGRLMTDVAVHHVDVRHTVISACLFVEAFMNGVAHSYRRRPRVPLDADADRYLSEHARDPKTGLDRIRFVSLKDKLTKWLQIISPRGDTIDTTQCAFRTFREVQEYRDSIVHLSAPKTTTYRALDVAVATRAADAAVAVAMAICQSISDEPTRVAYPQWLSGRKDCGLFEVTPTIAIPTPG